MPTIEKPEEQATSTPATEPIESKPAEKPAAKAKPKKAAPKAKAAKATKATKATKAAKPKKPAAKKAVKKVEKDPAKKVGILRLLASVLAIKRACTAVEIAEKMGITKGAVNRYLGSSESHDDGTAVGVGYLKVSVPGGPDAEDGEKSLRYTLTAAGRKLAEKQVQGAGSLKAAASRPMSQIEAAIEVLKASGQPMRCKEMIEVMEKKGLWNSPGGKTPAATLNAAIGRDLLSETPRFERADRGAYRLTKAGKK